MWTLSVSWVAKRHRAVATIDLDAVLSLSNTRANSKNLLINSQVKNCLGVIEGNGQGRMSPNGDDEIG